MLLTESKKTTQQKQQGILSVQPGAGRQDRWESKANGDPLSGVGSSAKRQKQQGCCTQHPENQDIQTAWVAP